jgi:tetraacyldisaccharide 4'-kinase
LSRGYGRKEFGFKIANKETTSRQIGDEPLQFYKKFGTEITVAVESDRVKGVMDICYEREDTDLVVLDDAFQHRSIQPGFSILLTDYNRPFYTDYVLPVGDLRELRHGKNRADIIIMTKCPKFEELNKTEIIHKIKPNLNQSVFFSKVVYGDVYELNTFNVAECAKKNIILVTGIAKPNPLLNYLKKYYNVLEHCKFGDHYRFKEKDIDDISNLLIKFAELEPILMTTEKDAMRLIGSEFEVKVKQQPWFYQTITVELDDKEKFDKLILEYVQENRRDY